MPKCDETRDWTLRIRSGVADWRVIDERLFGTAHACVPAVTVQLAAIVDDRESRKLRTTIYDASARTTLR